MLRADIFGMMNYQSVLLVLIVQLKEEMTVFLNFDVNKTCVS